VEVDPCGWLVVKFEERQYRERIKRSRNFDFYDDDLYWEGEGETRMISIKEELSFERVWADIEAHLQFEKVVAELELVAEDEAVLEPVAVPVLVAEVVVDQVAAVMTVADAEPVLMAEVIVEPEAVAVPVTEGELVLVAEAAEPVPVVVPVTGALSVLAVTEPGMVAVVPTEAVVEPVAVAVPMAVTEPQVAGGGAAGGGGRASGV